ncbi:MAG: isoprenylcysteine carboxylmethyltransferase family protein [bacterium]|nr:isoprenylcysteine carboxylmethyltransferase family protein [bacterium]
MPIPIDKTLALVVGLFLILAGVILLAAGMIEFRSLRRSCGQDISKLVATGIYQLSRNPQFIGCLLILLGASLAGRSLFAFILAAAASIIICWYTIRLAEPYLERLYGKEYRQYKKRVPRWFSIPFKKK